MSFSICIVCLYFHNSSCIILSFASVHTAGVFIFITYSHFSGSETSSNLFSIPHSRYTYTIARTRTLEHASNGSNRTNKINNNRKPEARGGTDLPLSISRVRSNIEHRYHIIVWYNMMGLQMNPRRSI